MAKIKEIDRLRDNLEQLKKEYNLLQDECVRNGDSWDVMCSKTHDIKQRIWELRRKIRLSEEPKISYVKKIGGELFTMEEFINNAKSGAFTDNDGYGVYCTEKAMSNISVLPSDILADDYRHDFSHIRWFNK